MCLTKLAIALCAQALFFGVLGYLDTVQMLRASWRETVSFGLRPYVLAWLLCGPFLFWWSLRAIYEFTSNSFWTTNLVVVVVVFTAGIGARWYASGISPGKGDFIALILMFLGLVASRVIK